MQIYFDLVQNMFPIIVNYLTTVYRYLKVCNNQNMLRTTILGKTSRHLLLNIFLQYIKTSTEAKKH